MYSMWNFSFVFLGGKGFIYSQAAPTCNCIVSSTQKHLHLKIDIFLISEKLYFTSSAL